MNLKTENSIEIIILAGTKSAAVAGGYKGILHLFPGVGQIAQLALAGIEVGALTKVTTNMCKDIVKVYGYENISGISSFIGVVVGAATGGIMATKIVELIPGIGAAASAVTTFSLHVLTGTVITSICELLDEDLIDKSYLTNEGLKSINELFDLMTGIIADTVRGYSTGSDLKEALNKAVNLTKIKIRSGI